MSNFFTCIIVDDECDAAELLAARLGYLYKNITVQGSYNQWENALFAVRHKQPDILFLDISMPGKNGIDFLRLLPGIQSEIIFTTAYSEFAYDAFKFSATGYILKPIDDIELSAAVNKAMERIQYKKLAKQDIPKPAQNPKIGISDNKGTDYVNIDDIIYLEADNRCTKIITKGGWLVSSYNLGRFKDLLNPQLFCQVHRSFIINLNCVIRYETSGAIIMSDKKAIPISKNNKEEFLGLFSKVAKTS